MKNYKAILFHPEGDYVTDFQRENKQDIWEELAEMGSRWIFYPIAFIATDKTIVDAPEGMDFLIGKRIKTVVRYFKETWQNDSEAICRDIEAGIPLSFIYPSI